MVLILMIICWWLVITPINCSSHRMYNTDYSFQRSDTFDCLEELELRRSVSKKGGLFAEFVLFHYCRRLTEPAGENPLPSFNITNLELNGHTVISFQHLRALGVTVQQMMEWHAPIDIVEDYIQGITDGLLFNCSDLWFGPHCQYTLDSPYSLHAKINQRFSRKRATRNVLSITNGSCYILDGCDSTICLDWREICDGKWDCYNGIDEHNCYLLEINQCDPLTEYRCADGLCIPKEMYMDYSPDCMDQSDEIYGKLHNEYCFSEPMNKKCDDYRCLKMEFSCGDGHCIKDDDGEVCRSQRDLFYRYQVKSLMAIDKPILFGHITLEYKIENTTTYLCYNSSLCPYLFNMTVSSNKSTGTTSSRICQTLTSLTNNSIVNNFDEMLADIQRHIRCACSVSPLLPSIECSITNKLYQCTDGRCISIYRLSDGRDDCTHGEDEHSIDVCSLALPYRFKCDLGRRCISQLLLHDRYRHCNDGSDEIISDMVYQIPYLDQNRVLRGLKPLFDFSFLQLCNGLVEYTNGYDTDETDCSPNEWPCRRPSTIKDNVWHCHDGRDELPSSSSFPKTLSSIHCSGQQYFCFNKTNGKPMCLPMSRAGDGQIDCLGASDERDFCRRNYPNSIVHRYHCLNSNICISPFELCDCKQDCEQNDDETLACDWLYDGQEPICNQKFIRCHNGEIYEQAYIRCDGSIYCRDGEDELFCDLIDRPSIDRPDPDYIDEYTPTKQIVNRNIIHTDDFIAWYCNRGIYVRSSDEIPNGQSFYCFCPSNYYGDRCQFQRKRLSLIVQPQMIGMFVRENTALAQTSFILKIVILFMDNNLGTIVDHSYFTYISSLYCLPKYEISLRYPINASNTNEKYNHSVHIYAFQAEQLTLHTYWKLDYVPFSFLPINRIVQRFIISTTPDKAYTSIPFLSREKTCSCWNKSLCLMGNDDSHVCVCPLGYIGRRCLIPSNNCDRKDITSSCKHSSQCVPYDERLLWGQEVCMCENGAAGDDCARAPTQIDVSFDSRISMPLLSIAFIYIIPTHITYEPDKVVLFQRLLEGQTGFIANLTVNISSHTMISNNAYIQLFENRKQFDIYHLSLNEKDMVYSHVGIYVNLSHRCWPVHELFDESIYNVPFLRRVKYFHRPCKERREVLPCFYDTKLMCHCDKNYNAVCFNFETTWTSHGCDERMCNSRGICIQDSNECPMSSLCLCEPCAFGAKCQFETRGYSLSLDAIIGSSNRRSTIVHITIAFFTVLIISGFLLNSLATATFCQRTMRDLANGLYLLISSLLGIFTLIVLSIKIALLLSPSLSQANTNISCATIEFLLKWFTASGEWLNACVAIERTITVLKGASFNQLQRKKISKWCATAVIILLGGLSSVELVFRRLLIDDQDDRFWCVLTLNQDRHPIGHTLYAIFNVLVIVLPLVINLTSAILIIIGTTRSKLQSKFIRREAINVFVRKQIFKHKHILVGPTVLGLLAIPRLVFTFIFVCTKLDRRPFLSLFAYFLGFLPSTANLFVFILPSAVYRAALHTLIKQYLACFRAFVCRR